MLDNMNRGPLFQGTGPKEKKNADNNQQKK